MSQALRIIEQLRPESGPPLALELPDGLPFDDWVAVGRKLRIGSQAINWHIGDWWAFGDHRYGQRARVAAEGIFGLEFQSLMDLAVVSRRFEPSRRREVISFTHHREVLGLPAEEADALLDRAERDRLSTRDIRREVQAIKASNDTGIGVVSEAEPAERKPPQEFTLTDLLESYARYVEAMERIEEYAELTKRESDYLAICLDRLGEAHVESRAVPDTFEIYFIEQGRIACETEYGASRITVTRWMRKAGFKRLRDLRAAFVRQQRQKAKSEAPLHADDAQSQIDLLLPIARQAAQHLRVSRWGGHTVSQHEAGGWLVGTVRKSSEELITMAERVGFNRADAAAEADREGY